MTTRTTAVGTQSSGDTLSAAEYNDAAGGWIQRYAITSDLTGITTAQDLTGLATTTFTVPANRIYLFWFDLVFQSTAASDSFQVKLLEDGNDLKRWDFIGHATANTNASANGFFLYAPTNASHTYKLQGARGVSATGTFKVVASASAPAYPAQFCMMDIGPS